MFAQQRLAHDHRIPRRDIGPDASRSTGGVWITDSSRSPDMAICRVRGIGVAVRVRTWTSSFSALSFSLWATPKCSSSTITSPSFLNLIDFDSSAWVPMTMSTVPFQFPPGRLGLGRGTSRDSPPISIGKP